MRVAESVLTRVRTMVFSARLSRRSPPRMSRCRVVFPDDAGGVVTPRKQSRHPFACRRLENATAPILADVAQHHVLGAGYLSRDQDRVEESLGAPRDPLTSLPQTATCGRGDGLVDQRAGHGDTGVGMGCSVRVGTNIESVKVEKPPEAGPQGARDWTAIRRRRCF